MNDQGVKVYPIESKVRVRKIVLFTFAFTKWFVPQDPSYTAHLPRGSIG